MASKHLYATKVTANDSTAKEQLGAIRVEWNSTDSCFKTYKYVQASLSAAAANGTALCYFSSTAQIVQDVAGIAGRRNLPAGVAVGALTDQYYGWIQVAGYHSAIKTTATDGITLGQNLCIAGTGTVEGYASITEANGSTLRIGVSVAADVDASDTVAGRITCNFDGLQ